MHRAGLLLLVAACGRESAPTPTDELTKVEWAQLARMSPLPAVPLDATNTHADDPGAAALGQMLFFDKQLAGVPDVSCHTCHAGPAMDDPGKHVSVGAKTGTRNSPPLINAAFYSRHNWGGRFDSLWALSLGAIEKPEVMGGSRAAVARVVGAKYAAEYQAVFGAAAGDVEADPAKATTVFVNAGKAIAAYMRLLVARNAPFDRWIAGDESAVSPAAKRGARLFLQHCKSCHDGPHFTDNKFHALGVAQFGAGVPAEDLGLITDVVDLAKSPFNAAGTFSDSPRTYKHGPLPEMRGQFRTPTLRNVAVTAPYMHAGQFATLDAVMAFYNVGGGNVDGVVKDPEMKRLGLTAAQQADLVAFMQTLTDTMVPPALLVDTARK